MKKFLLIALIGLSAIVGCKKDSNSTPSSTNTNNTTTGFTWTENGGSTITADSAFWTTGSWGTGVRAYKSGMANYFEINWSTQDNTSAGAKTGSFTFLKGNSTYNATTTINITSNANTKLSGNFTSAVSGGTVTTITANFNNIAKK